MTVDEEIAKLLADHIEESAQLNAEALRRTSKIALIGIDKIAAQYPGDFSMSIDPNQLIGD